MNRILELRNLAKLSQADLAKFVGCSQRAISNYEKEQRQIPYDVIDKLCSAFDCSADYLIGRSDIKKAPVAYSDERPNSIPHFDGPYAQESDLFRRIQEANSLFLKLDEAGKAQAIAYLQFLAAQQATDSDAQG